jgi:hypothetical protein
MAYGGDMGLIAIYLVLFIAGFKKKEVGFKKDHVRATYWFCVFCATTLPVCIPPAASAVPLKDDCDGISVYVML